MEHLPGFRDFYPEPLPSPDVWSADLRGYILDRWRAVAKRYGFREYDGPPLEPLELYTVKSGDEIVGQLYNFIDKGERAVALRPEMTPTLARMIGAHARNYKKPIKWFTVPQLFRYERQQKGRLREHFQLNADLLGETDSAADAELIALLIDVLRSFGLTENHFVIRLSSRQAWHGFFAQRSPDPAREYDFYQVIDKLEREDPDASKAKLAGSGIAFEQVQEFIQAGQPTAELQAVLDNLSARGLGGYVKIDYNVIRGLAYYTGSVFEAFDKQGQFRAIAGGGRYDHLVNLITAGRTQMPAIGFGMGDVVLAELLKANGLLPKFGGGLDAYVLVEDESLRPASLKWVQSWRDAGFAIEFSLVPGKAEKQFKRALDTGAPCTVRLERGTEALVMARCRDLVSREERSMPVQELCAYLQSSSRRQPFQC